MNLLNVEGCKKMNGGKRKMDYEDCYKVAIEERARHQQNYNHWMNMYAIFNGALLIAFTADGVCDLFKLLVSLLGVFTSSLWIMSVNGYYEWIISWIKVVSFYEAKLKNEGENVYIYRLFAKTKKKFPFSTQKCTKAFTISVLVGWCLLSIYEMLKIFPETNTKTEMKEILKLVKNFMCENILYIMLILVVLIVIILLVLIFSKKLREELTNTHKTLSKSKTTLQNQLDSELEEICDFDNNSK
ncbi:MAG: hypothetical protein J6J67_01390 [Treponema sp.]|nr:hypothetical protein [Treponema sp.]